MSSSIAVSRALALAALGLIVSMPVHAANFVNNGSFELPTAASGTQDTAATDWTFTGSAVRETGPANTNSNYFVGPSDGSSAIAFNPGNNTGGSVSTIFNAATLSGSTYTLTFDFGQYGPGRTGGPQSLVATVTNGASTLFSQSVVSGPGSAYNAKANYAPYSFTFIGDGAVDTLTFTDTTTASQADSNDGALDNVTVTGAVSAVPEPSSLLGLTVGLFGLGSLMFMTRRRTAPQNS